MTTRRPVKDKGALMQTCGLRAVLRTKACVRAVTCPARGREARSSSIPKRLLARHWTLPRWTNMPHPTPMIRQADRDDIAPIRALVVAAYSPYIARIGGPPGPMGDDYAARVAAGEAWVAEEDGAVQGLLVLEDRGEALLLDNVAVAPTAQGRGIGQALMAFTEAEARRRGQNRIELYTHALMAENIVLYRRWGFHETGRRREAGFDRVFMEKRLARADVP